MADTSVTSPEHVVDFLVGQHEHIKGLFDETLATSGPDRDEAFIRLRRLLAVHEAAEEEVVHPRARQILGDRHDIVEARLNEEREAKTALSELEDLDIDSPTFTEKLGKLRDAVVEHAEHEEREEFSKVRETLTDDALERMTRTVKLAELVAPTRPHAGIESRMANLFTAPFAAMMDRARDAILGYS